MNQKQLKVEVNKLSKTAVRVFRRDGYLKTFLVILPIFQDKKKGSGVVNIPDEMIEHRKELLQKLGENIRQDPKVKDIEAIMMMSEIFIGSKIQKGEKAILPSKDPHKKEGVIVAGMTQKGKQVVNIFEIKKWWKFKFLKKIDFKKGQIEQPLLKEFWKGYQEPVSIA